MNVNRERLAETFTALCEISSPSKKEKEVADHLKDIFTELGADLIYEDKSAEQTGSDSGNLIITYNGTDSSLEPILFACHMDTVTPADNIKVARNGDTFTSEGDTILGADDKSGIGAIIEMVTILKENNTSHRPFELVFTTCEEIGLLGAKNLEHDRLKAKFGYAIDTSDVDKAISKAPAANTIEVKVHGLSAHAGLAPEKGINAFSVAAKTIADLRLGRLDDESTSNFGVIAGGTARNVVPDLVTLKGEVRSHSEEKLNAYTTEITSAFNKTVDNWTNPFSDNTDKPSVEVKVEREYNALSLPQNSPAIKELQAVCDKSGLSIEFTATGGGSDANVLSEYGIEMAILGSGMQKVHTVDEFVELGDMVKITELICNLVISPNK